MASRVSGRDGAVNSMRTIGLGALSFVALVALVMMASVPLTLPAQGLLSVATLLIMIGILSIGGMEKWRLLFALVGLFLVLRYIIWRTFYTIPFHADLPTFIPGLLLYFAELYAVLVLVIGFFSIARPMRWENPGLPEEPENLPSVDVFVPSYNESAELLRTTLAACRNMDYAPERLTVYLLDDGGTDEKIWSDNAEKAAEARERRRELQDLCEELDCIYITRERNERAKAGNLNAAFHKTTGDLVAVFDADHVPSRSFLQMTAGHFLEDPDLFLVQTPHFFINSDPQERNLAQYERQHSEHEMFYHIVQPGLDNWNSCFFCGSAALMRRKHLMQNNGFSGESITEDCETALNLHAMGFNSRYVNCPLVAGLQPETLQDFIKQRTRWAQGMTQIFIFNNPMFKTGLNFGQRICYTSSMVFWLFPFARLIMILGPLVFLFFGAQIYDARVEEFLAYTLPGLVAVMLISSFLYGRYRPPLVSELYEFIQCTFLSRALLHCILNPRKPTFSVTSKDTGSEDEEQHLSPLAAPLLVLIVLMLGGVAVSAYRLITSQDLWDVYIVVAAWNLANLLVALSALGVVLEKPQRRKMPRVDIYGDGLFYEFDETYQVWQPMSAELLDASATGARYRIPAELLETPITKGDFIRVAPAEDLLHILRPDDGGVDDDPELAGYDPEELQRLYWEGHDWAADALTRYETRRKKEELDAQEHILTDENGVPKGVWLQVLNTRMSRNLLEFRGRFVPQTAQDHGAITAIVYGDHRRWQTEIEKRREDRNLLAGIGRFLRISAFATRDFVRFYVNKNRKARQARKSAASGAGGAQGAADRR